MSDAVQKLTAFLREHHVASLSTTGSEGPYATPLFYAVRDHPLALLFLSDPQTRHMREVVAEPRAAMGVYLETREVGQIQGAQLTGAVEDVEDDAAAWALYSTAFPEAGAYRQTRPESRLYAFRVDWGKLTDNRLGFGTKIEVRPG